MRRFNITEHAAKRSAAATLEAEEKTEGRRKNFEKNC